VEIASTLQLAIQHEEDLVVSAGSYLLSNPAATPADFRAWIVSMQAYDRYPELLGSGVAGAHGGLVLTPCS
jgi:hypothetical protein